MGPHSDDALCAHVSSKAVVMRFALIRAFIVQIYFYEFGKKLFIFAIAPG